jgi:hypothetical protein
MMCYFDESGDFSFPRVRFDCYTQAAVVCPDSYLAELSRYVQGRQGRWSVDELHASELSVGKRLSVCRFIAGSPMELIVQATDTTLLDADMILNWRRRQAATLQKNLATYREQGGQASDAEEVLNALTKRSSLPTRISDVEFVQAILLVDLTFAALQKSVIWFTGDLWREDFRSYHFIYDGKLPGKLGAGEKLLREIIVPVLGSNDRFRLDIADVWKHQQPPHPFIARFEREGGWSVDRRYEGAGIDVNLIFEHGLTFEQSNASPGVQIADVVAYVARQAVLEPTDPQAQLAYDLIREKLSFRHRAMSIVTLDGGSRAVPLERYRRLAEA